MTCKDCICSEVCYYKALNDGKKLKKRRDDVEKICKSFAHRDRLKTAPTVDAVEVVHGRWVTWQELFPKRFSLLSLEKKKGFCSYCGAFRQKDNYCPNCGAKMDGGNEDG